MHRNMTKRNVLSRRLRLNQSRPRLESLEARRLLSVYGDFNADGYADLAVTAPGEEMGGNFGAVHIIYGSASGLTAAHNQLITAGDIPQAGNSMGSDLAIGDFNGDGFSDLAIGAASYDVGTVENAGAVHIVFGSVAGLTPVGVQTFTQDSPRVRDVAEMWDGFGATLAVGDYNADGKDDLAVGVPGEDVGSADSAGAVQVLYGSSVGITPMGGQVFSQDSPGVGDSAEDDDRFGDVLTSGDFNGDGYADLAVGIPYEDVGTAEDAGAVQILFGGPDHLKTTNNQFWHQDVAGIQGLAEVDDGFGWALAAGDFNGDGKDDLAIGVPLEDLGTFTEAGAVHVLPGSPTGLTTVGSQLWTQDNAALGAGSEESDYFGQSLAAGNVAGSSYHDLVIGAPSEDFNEFDSTGAVCVLPGSATGLTATGGIILYEPNFGGAFTNHDSIGLSVAVGNFDGSGLDDIATGTTQVDIGLEFDAGAVFVRYATGTTQMWHQDSPGILGVAEAWEYFGFELGTGGAGANGGGGKAHGGRRSSSAASPETAERDASPEKEPSKTEFGLIDPISPEVVESRPTQSKHNRLRVVKRTAKPSEQLRWLDNGLVFADSWLF